MEQSIVSYGLPGREGPAVEDGRSSKVEVLCKECGRPFIKYAYRRLSRCEDCRAADGKPAQGNDE